jgi:uncharacterized membrane protein
MKPERFRIGDAVSYGWQTMTQNIWFFVLVMLIFFVASGIFGGFQNIAVRANGVAVAILAIIFALLNFIVGVFVGMAQVKIGVDFCDQKQADYNDLYNQYPSFWPFLAGTLLLGLLVTAGFILLIIPGIYWAVKYQFVPYLILDRNMGPFEAFHKAHDITQGVWWHLFVFNLAEIGIVFLGFILCCVGSFFAVPIVIVATAYVYRSLLANEPNAQMMAPPPQMAQQPQPPVAPTA